MFTSILRLLGCAKSTSSDPRFCHEGYPTFRQELLECFIVLKYDVRAECLSKEGQGPEKVRNIASQFGIASMQIINFKDCKCV